MKHLLSEQLKDGLNDFVKADKIQTEDQVQLGRPITETTDGNIEHLRNLINGNPHVTIEEIQIQSGLSHGTVQRIIFDHLNLKKTTARYIPKNLTATQRAEGVQICKENLEKLEKDTWRLYDVVIADEAWLYHEQLGRKASNPA